MSADTASPPSREEILSLVRDQLAEILEIEPAAVTEDATFSQLGADSLALIELVEAIEENLAGRVGDFRIDDEDLEGLESVRSAVDYVTAKLNPA